MHEQDPDLDVERYSRQTLFAPIGQQGQARLRNSHVLLIGAGALGTASAEALVRAGIGQLTIADRDYVEISNLQRQTLYTEADAAQRLPKAIAASNQLKQINSAVTIHAHITDVTADTLAPMLAEIDLILDATDNFDVRMLINDMAHQRQIPWVYGACVGSYGLSYTIIPGQTPCLHCLLGTLPQGGATCDTVGIISPAVQMVVAHQISEVLKWLVGDQAAMRGKLISFDLWRNHFSTVDVTQVRKADCPTCGDNPSYPYLSRQNQTKSEVLCGRNTVQIRPPQPMVRDLDKLAVRLSKQPGQLEQNPFLLSLSVGAHRLVMFRDGRVLIHGTADVTLARSLYHQYLG